jgi:hypothetical protein
MTNRHRVPTIFTLYMVDVLCCALGCVIFLWFLKLHEAHLREKAAAQTASTLARTQSQLDVTNQAFAEARYRLQTLEQERDRVIRDREAARSRVTALEGALAGMLTRATSAEDRLTKKEARNRELEKSLQSTEAHSEALAATVSERDASLRAARRSADELADKLRDADAHRRALQPQADLVPALRDEIRLARDKLAALQARSDSLDKELTDRRKDLAGADRNVIALEEENRKLSQDLRARTRESSETAHTIEALQSDKKTLSDQMTRVRAAAENRFAGLALTGRRVVFIVDMSGSMDLVDERTLAPEKWSGVRESLVKIMRSLPDLEKFQIVVFSDRVLYLLGDEDRWLDYDAHTSADQVARALAAIKPRGNTNMYDAFEAAFRFRQAGMDTIYFFSDGLPNVGTGLNEETARNMKEPERAEILGKTIRRKLAADWNREMPGRPRVRINAVGFFYESPDVGAFLWALTRENDGGFVGMSKP